MKVQEGAGNDAYIEEYYVKPMNCPFHIQVYQFKKRSYRDLPMRLAELGTVYRYEKDGVRHGLFRVRGFTQDDAHIFCTPDQIVQEVKDTVRFAKDMLGKFGFTEIQAYLSTKPAKAVGEEARWEQATQSLREALEQEGMSYEVDEGGGAFYGPKIDLKIKDALGRPWQLGTVQFDFNLPERFDLTYVGDDGKNHRPYMVHRALLGSIERFFGILIEHYAGAFPLWLAPEQVRILPISDKALDYARKTQAALREAGYRVDVDISAEKLGAKIREATLQKVPYQVVVGPRDEANGTISVRSRVEGDLGAMQLPEFVAKLRAEMAS
jgi:threonyl-tRNA synthetase